MKRLFCCAFEMVPGQFLRLGWCSDGRPWFFRCLAGVMGATLSACSVAPTWPDLPLPESMTRASIEEYRAREEERLQRALRECYQRFAVNDCRREALSRDRDVQHHLRAQELHLNALDREERQRKLQSSPASTVPAAPAPNSTEPRP